AVVKLARWRFRAAAKRAEPLQHAGFYRPGYTALQCAFVGSWAMIAALVVALASTPNFALVFSLMGVSGMFYVFLFGAFASERMAGVLAVRARRRAHGIPDRVDGGFDAVVWGPGANALRRQLRYEGFACAKATTPSDVTRFHAFTVAGMPDTTLEI